MPPQKRKREKKEDLNRWRDEGKPISNKDRGEFLRMYDPKKLMEEILAWADKDDSISVTAFCAEGGYLSNMIWRLEQSDKDFQHCYELVKMKIASRREKLVNANLMNYGTYSRYQKMYDPFLAKHEDDEKDKDAARARGIALHEQANLIKLADLASKGKIRQED